MNGDTSRRRSLDPTRRLRRPLVAGLLAPASALFAQGEPLGAPQSAFLSWTYFILGLVAIWLFFYMMVYPALLRHFSPFASKAFFWPLVLLYWLFWIHLSFYWFFPYGWLWLWMRWGAAFLALIFLLWFIVALSRRTD